jgi:hypothetical protein
MSEEDNSINKDNEQEHPEYKDWLLETFISMANKYNTGFDITFSVGGTLTSGREFMCQLDETLSQAYTEAGAQIETLGIKEAADDVYSKEDTPIEYLHVKNLQVVGPDTIHYHNFPYWRFSLTKIEGWTLGRSTK